jgi:lipoprotein-anchoring transpeptidase ErfK/SrfK
MFAPILNNLAVIAALLAFGLMRSDQDPTIGTLTLAQKTILGAGTTMGVAAMTLAGGEYAIHGTNVPGSIGGFVSYGCIRMLNDDISDLYQRVPIGTTVTVMH